ncbi:MAG: ribonuclease HII [Methylophilaceae bacterium]|nr:ribonuclease HII [Methylophilaceae bacterium]
MDTNDNLLICGVDEAGRGPLAGAVYAAAVILDPLNPIPGLADSKTLSEKKRISLAAQIKQHALAWSIASSSVEEIDEINILQASLLAMKRAIETLQTPAGIALEPHLVLVDGLHCPSVAFPAQAIVKGDSKVQAIAAASILAKTARDDDLYELDKIYPQYNFAQHKGYPTAEHLTRLKQHGVSPVHRRSYAPVKNILTQLLITHSGSNGAGKSI